MRDDLQSCAGALGRRDRTVRAAGRAGEGPAHSPPPGPEAGTFAETGPLQPGLTQGFKMRTPWTRGVSVLERRQGGQGTDRRPHEDRWWPVAGATWPSARRRFPCCGGTGAAPEHQEGAPRQHLGPGSGSQSHEGMSCCCFKPQLWSRGPRTQRQWRCSPRKRAEAARATESFREGQLQ